MLSFQQWGNENAPDWLAVHGWLDNSSSFIPLANLVKNELKITAIDLPGHGKSPGLQHFGAPHFLDWVLALREFLNHSGLKTTSLMGHSMGGAAALLYAGLFPDEIKKVICFDSLGPFSAEASQLARRIRDFVFAKEFLAKKKQRFSPELKEMISRKQAATGISYETAKAIVERGVIQTPDGWTWSHDPLLTLPTAVRFTEEQVRALLSEVKAEVLVIEADDNPLKDRALMDSRKPYLRSLTIEKVSGNHYIHSERAQEVAELVLRYARR